MSLEISPFVQITKMRVLADADDGWPGGWFFRASTRDGTRVDSFMSEIEFRTFRGGIKNILEARLMNARHTVRQHSRNPLDGTRLWRNS